jgi:hypothetical protein
MLRSFIIYCGLSQILLVRSNQADWEGRGMRHAWVYEKCVQNSSRKPEGNRLLRGTKRRLEDNIKMRKM